MYAWWKEKWNLVDFRGENSQIVANSAYILKIYIFLFKKLEKFSKYSVYNLVIKQLFLLPIFLFWNFYIEN